MLQDWPATSDEPEDHDDDRDYQEHMNDAAHDRKHEPTKQPENEKDYCDCPEHRDASAGGLVKHGEVRASQISH